MSNLIKSFKAATLQIVVLLGAGIGLPKTALAVPDFVWSDVKGLVVPYSCTEDTLTRIPFAISAGQISASGKTPTDTLISQDGATRFLLARHSLVQAFGQPIKGAFQVEVLSTPGSGPEYPYQAQRGWGTSKALSPAARQKLMLSQNALRALDNYVLQVHDTSIVSRPRGRDLNVRNTYWQVAMSGDNYRIVRCDAASGSKRAYLLFNVFSNDSSVTGPVALVGVSERETGIFSQMTGHHLSDVDDKFLATSEILTRDNANSGQSAIASTSSVSVPATEPAATPTRPSVSATKPSVSAPTPSASSGAAAQKPQTSPQSQSLALSTRPQPRPQTAAAEDKPSVVEDEPSVDGDKPSADEGTSEQDAKEAESDNPQGARLVDDQETIPVPKGVEVATGGFDQVVCIMDGSLRVRDQTLKSVIFKALPFEAVKSFQSWDADEKSGEISSGTYTFQKVQFPDRQGKIGWVAESYVSLRSECKPLNDALKERELIACTTDSSSLNVRDDSDKLIFRVNQFENLALKETAQSEKRQTNINGTSYTMVPVYFTDMFRGGWIPEAFVKTRQNCPGYDRSSDPGIVHTGSTSNVNHPNLRDWLFPLKKKPLYSYNKGPNGGARYFGASRSGGRRLHAAADLFGKVGDGIESAQDGVILRKDVFYSGTWQVNIKHTGGYVVRYGEVGQNLASWVFKGSRIRKGRHFAKIGRLNCRCGAMLHFELYRGNLEGSLTDYSGSRYQRRADLMDPTEYLLVWEMLRFRSPRGN